jgi:hypothetical protein
VYVQNYENDGRRRISGASHYSALLVRFFAGLLSPGTFLSSDSSALLLPKTGPAGTLPNITGFPARFAGLVKPAGRSEPLLTDFEGALSLVWKSSFGAALLAGSPRDETRSLVVQSGHGCRRRQSARGLFPGDCFCSRCGCTFAWCWLDSLHRR